MLAFDINKKSEVQLLTIRAFIPPPKGSGFSAKLFYNIQYRDIFGYAPCREDYICNQDEYFNALRNAIASKTELSKFLRKRDNGSKKQKK